MKVRIKNIRQNLVCFLFSVSLPFLGIGTIAKGQDDPEKKDLPKVALYGGVQPVGYDVRVPWEMGASFGLVRSEKVTNEFSIVHGKAEVVDHAFEGGEAGYFKYRVIRNGIEFGSKNYLRRTFYYGIGLSLDDFTVNYPVEVAGSVAEKRLDGRIFSLGLPVGLGNRWVFDSGLSIGCDWIRVVVPVSRWTDFDSDSEVDQEDREDQEREMKRTFGFWSLQLLRFQIGLFF